MGLVVVYVDDLIFFRPMPLGFRQVVQHVQLHRTGKLTNFCIQKAAIGCGPQKRTGAGPVHSPAAVTIPLQKHRNTKITLPYRRVSEATQHYAETRDPPSQDPRDHIEQAIKA